jgi:alpha-amylase
MVRSAVLICVIGQTDAAKATAGVGLQAFDWNDISDRAAHFGKLSGRASEFSGAGFSHVWTPPPSQSVDSQGYLPGKWYNIEGGDSLKKFTSALSASGVKPVCDIVINHRTAAATDSCNGEYISFASPDWGPWGVVSNDAKCDSGNYCDGSCSCGGADTGDNFCPAPDVDHTNSQVQSDIVAWLKWLKSTYNFAGWRFDFAVGFSPSYIKQYVSGAGGDFAVGEYFDTNADKVSSWASGSGQHAFDFPQRFALKSAIASGDFSQLRWGQNPLGFAGMDAASACTFLDNHDTARPSGQGGGDGGFGNDYDIMLGYAYILTHPAFPWVFLPHLDGSNGADIKKLVGIRNSAKVSPADLPYIATAANGVYAAYIGTQTEGSGKLAMKVGPDSWSPSGSGWGVAASGNNWAVWTKSAETLV